MHNRLYIAPEHPQERANRDTEAHEAYNRAGCGDGRKSSGARDVNAHAMRWGVRKG